MMTHFDALLPGVRRSRPAAQAMRQGAWPCRLETPSQPPRLCLTPRSRSVSASTVVGQSSASPGGERVPEGVFGLDSIRSCIAGGLILFAAGALVAVAAPAAAQVNVAVGDLESGGAVTVEFLATVDQPVASGTTAVCNQGTVSGDNFDPDAQTDDPSEPGAADATCTPVEVLIDLVVSKAESADPVVAGSGAGNLTYVVTVLNNSLDTATGVALSEVLTTPLPAGVTLDSVTPSAPTTFDGGTGTWSVGTLAPGGSATLTVVLTVDATAAAGTDVICDTATVTAVNETLVNTGDDSATECTSVAREVDLVVSKTESADPVVAGSGAGNLTYEVTVENAGPSDATAVTLSEVLTLPAGVSVDSVTASTGTSFDSGTDTWTVGDLAVGADATLTVVLTVGPATAAGTDVVCNTATVTGAGETLIYTADDSATECTSVAREVDLVVSKTESIDSVIGGSGAGNLTYVVTVANDGPSEAGGVTLSEVLTLPAGVSVVSITPSQGSFDSGTDTWSVGDLAAGVSATLTVVLTVGPSTAAGTDVICNTAEVTGSNETLINTGDDSATECTSVGREVDIQLAKTESVDPAIAGSGPGNLTYVVTVTNAGPSDATGVVIEEVVTLPAGVTLDSVTPSPPTGFTPPDTWTVGDLPSGTSATLTLVLTVSAAAVPGTDVICDTATVDAVTEPDGDAGNDSVTECTSIAQAADLSITKEGDADPPAAGANLTYTITVENLGPSDATNVVVTDPLPAAVTYVSDTCGGADLPPWTWNAGTLAAGASVSCDVVVSIDPSPPGSISNTASVTSDIFDDDLSNNSATEETILDNVPPEVVSVAALPSGQVLTNGVLVTTSITGLEVAFSEAMQDPPGDTDPDDVTNPANYVLVRPGPDGTFQTVSCAAGLAGDDLAVTIQGVTYDAGIFTATLDLGSPLPVDDYRFFACGSATLRDLAGNPLAGGDDFEVEFRMASVLEIPTLDEVGLVLLVLLLALAGLWLLGRRRGGFGPTAAAGLLAAALLGAAAALASAQVVIDEFTTTQGPLADPGTSSSTAATGGADILGQERDLVVLRSSGSGTVSAEVTGGELDFTVPAATTGELLATWDGADGDASALDPDGLGVGGVDLTDGGTQGGFRLVIEEATAGTYLLLTVHQDADNVSRAARVLPAIGSTTALFIDFSELVPAPGALGPADLTDVGAITLLVGARDDDPGPSLFLSHFETAPPAVAALKVDRTPAGDPIAGAVNPGDTIRYRVTITNPGGGAEGVDFEDLVSADPNLSFVAGSMRTTPLARRDHYRTVLDTPIDSAAAALPSLLANDSDFDGDALEAVQATDQPTSQGGTVDIEEDGHFVYTPPAGFVGVDSFTYTIAPTAGDPITDAAGDPVGPAVGTAQVFIDRAPPVVVAGGVLLYTENDPPTAVDPGLAVSDEDSPNLAGATAQITGNHAMGEDELSFVDQLGITGSWDSVSGTLTLSGSSSVTNYQTALRSVAYENSSDDPSELTRTVTWIADDGLLSSAPATSTIEVEAVNDPPVLAGAGTVTFTEGDPPVAVAPALTVTDVDDANLESATVTITNLLDAGEELLAADTTGTSITAVYAAPTLSLTGTDTLANYQAVLQGVTYENTSVDPDETDRSVTFVVNDGEDDSNTETATVEVVAVNTPPVLTNDPISYATAGNTQLHAGGASIAGLVSIDDADSALVKSTPTDPDGPAAPTVVPASGMSTNGGDFGIAADGSFTYVPPAGFSGADSFTYQVTDTLDSTLGTIEITVSEVVWYVRDVVDANNPAGGDGRSTDAFETLAGAEGDSDADHIIFVFRGNTGVAALGDGITLKNGQKLHGEGIGLVHPTHGTLVLAGTRPRITNATAGGNGVTVLANTLNGDRTGIEIRGLEISGAANAVDATSENAANLGVRIGQNTISGAGAEGIDVNVGSTNTGQTLSLHDNTVTATGTGIDVTRTAGTLTITAFGDNTVTGTTGGSGIVVNGPSVTFDAVPGGSFDTVAGGVLAIGTSGNPVGGHGLFLNQVSGDLSYTSINVFAGGGAGGTGVRVGGTGQFTGAAGTRFRHLSPGTGVVETTGGPAVDINPTTADLRLATISSTNSTGRGVSLVSLLDGTGTTAQFSAGAGSTISGAAATAFHVDGGDATIAYGGTISNSAGRSVEVLNRTGTDTVTFTGGITDTGAGILLNANSAGTTTTFSGGMTLSTGANNGFVATGGGTVTVTDPAGATNNTITAAGGTALNVSGGTTIGAGGMTFESISANGGASGIVLNNTGSGVLTVTGDGDGVPDASGGHVQNTTGVGVSLTSARASLSELNISHTGSHGMDLNSVTNFTYQDATIFSAGNGNEEQGINILNLLGTSLIEDIVLDDITEDGIQFRQNSSTAGTTTIRRLNVQDHVAGFGEAGIEIQPDLASNLTVLIDDSDFAINTNAIMGVAMSTAASHTGTVTVTVQDSTFNCANAFGSGSIQALGGGSGSITYNVTGNQINSTKFDGIRINNDDTATTRTTISSNVITGSGATNNGEGITLRQDENGTLIASITGNTISEIKSNGIRLQSSDDTSNDAGIELSATISGNTATVRGDGFGAGLLIDVGDGSGIAKNDACANISGNNFLGTNSAAFFDFDITLQLNETADASLRITQASEAALSTANSGDSVSTFANPPNTITFNGGACATP